MDPKEFDQKLVEKIKEEKISPKPRWHFLLKNGVVWASGILALLIGAAAVSVMIYLLKYSGWELRAETHKSFMEFFLLTLPYFWIVFLGLFVFLLYYNVKHTKTGYRYPIWMISVSGVLASIILGSVFYMFGLGRKIDNVLGEKAPLYEIVINRQMSFWFAPEEGRLSGMIASEVSDGRFYLIDPVGNAWQVSGRDFDDEELPEFLKAGEPVSIVGRVTGKDTFRADFVKPLGPGRRFFTRPEMREHLQHCADNNGCLPPMRMLPPENILR